MSRISHLVGAALFAAAFAASAHAAAVRPGFDGESFYANDDESIGPVAIGFTIDFFGAVYSDLYVNNNGNVTFDDALGTYTPFDLTSTSTPIIAPFFSDVDTRGAGSSLVTYGAGAVGGRDAFGVNWVDVGYFASRYDKLNSFQLVIIDRSDTGAGNFDFEFNFDTIAWETGEASDGVDGLGGFSARVGYSNGTGAAGTEFELAGSAVNGAFLDGGPRALIANMINSTVAGRYVFEARGGSVIEPPDPMPSVPAPAAAPLLVSALGAVALLRRRRTARA